MIKLTEKIGYGFRGHGIVHVLETVWRLLDDFLYGRIRITGSSRRYDVFDNSYMGLGL